MIVECCSLPVHLACVKGTIILDLKNQYSDMKNSTLLRLDRQYSFWCMDRDTLINFWEYINCYLNKNDALKDKYDTILYAKIKNKDIAVVCEYFGAHFPDSETLLLTMVYQDFYILPRMRNFDLYLCVNNNGQPQFSVVHVTTS